MTPGDDYVHDDLCHANSFFLQIVLNIDPTKTSQ